MKINVKYEDNVLVLDEFCPVGEKWEFICPHTYTAQEDNEVTQYYGDTDISYNQKVEVCVSCDEVIA